MKCGSSRVTTCPVWWLLLALEGRDEPVVSVTVSQAVAAARYLLLIFPG